MVVGAAIQNPSVDIGSGSTSEAFEEVRNEFGLQVPNEAHPHFCIDHGRTPAAEVDCGEPESFVHGHKEISRTQNAPFAAEGLIKCLAEHDSDILYSMVLVDIQVAVCFETEIETSMVREQLEHVVKETNPCRNLVAPSTIDIQLQPNVGFFGWPMDSRGSHICVVSGTPNSSTTLRNAPRS